LSVILEGARTPSTDKAPSVLVMPGFGKRLDDSEAAALATFLRQGWNNAAGSVSARDVAKVRTKLNDAKKQTAALEKVVGRETAMTAAPATPPPDTPR
ncbi:MAG TPA: cytochrome c, partial [Duganella sp.]